MPPHEIAPPPRPETRVLLTGAAGGVGGVLRDGLAGRYATFRMADRADLGLARPGEEVSVGDIRDMAWCEAITRDIDCAVHLAAQPVEAPWPGILGPNIEGCYNLFEAARLNGVRRVIFASSNHAVGFHRTDRVLDRTSPTRPDSRYGLSKVFGEALGRMYADKYGLEVACLRIGSMQPTPQDRRQLATWLSPGDLVRMVAGLIDAERFHFITPYGSSHSSTPFWTNDDIHEVAFDIRDFVRRLPGRGPPGPAGRPSRRFVGGTFCTAEFTGDPDRID